MDTPLSILLIDDNPDDRVAVIRGLQQQFSDLSVTQVPEPQTLDRALDAGDFDLVITDYQLHWTNGLSILRTLKSRYPDCPVIMFTGTGSEEIAVEAMKLGLDDYVLKSPKHVVRLPSAVRLALERTRQRRALRDAETRYRDLVNGIPIGLSQSTPDGQILETNPAFAQMLGYPDADALRGINATDLYVDPQARARWKAVIEQTGVVVRFDVELRRQDGDTIWVESNARAVRDANGNSIRYEGSLENITERKRAEEALRAKIATLQALAEIDREIIVANDARAILELVIRKGAELLRAPKAAIAVQDKSSARMSASYGLDDPEAIQSEFTRLWRAGLFAGKQDRISAMNEVPADSPYFPEFRARENIRSAIFIPFSSSSQRGGLLAFDTRPRAWSADEVNTLQLLAGQACIALDKISLFEETRRRLGELEVVNRVSTALRAAATVDEMLPRLLDETLAAMRTDAGAIIFYDAGREEFRKAAARGWYTQIPDTPMPAGEAFAERVRAVSIEHLSREFASDPEFSQAARDYVPPGWGGAAIPIRAGQDVIGLLCVAVPLPRELSSEDASLLITLAEIAGSAIQRTRLHEQTVRQLRQLTVLHAIDVAIGGSFDLRMTFDVFLSQVTTQLNVDAAVVFLFDPHAQRLEYAADKGFRGRDVKRLAVRLGEGIVGRAALERRIVTGDEWPATRDASLDARHSALVASEGFVACIAVPLITKGQLKGVLELFYRAPFTADSDWRGFLGTLASQAAIAIDGGQLFEQAQRLTTDLIVAYDATIEGWSRALDLRDKETEGHTQRVAEMTEQLARAMGVRNAELVHVRRGALLHDIGKMGVPDAILLKPGALTDEEWKIMRLHPQLAHDMLAPIEYLRPALDIPYCHHEKWDGSGYPRGLKGENIPLAARIFAIVDVYDAVTSDRPYRRAWSEEKARDYIREQAGKHFDPRVVEAFLTMMGSVRVADK